MPFFQAAIAISEPDFIIHVHSERGEPRCYHSYRGLCLSSLDYTLLVHMANSTIILTN